MIRTIPNFRDAGGLPTRSGGTVRTGGLFRCGLPCSVAESERDALLGLDFGLIGDLRYASEQEREPSPWPEHWADRIVSYAGSSDQTAPHTQLLREGSMTVDKSRVCYEAIYRAVPFDPEYQITFGRVLSGLATGRDRVLVHCSAGKDRTGMVVALMHHALGVERDAMYENFLLSNEAEGLHAMAEEVRRRVRENHGHDYSPELMRHLIGVEASYLDAFFDEITRRSGSVDAYLAGVGFDQRARERALEHWVA